MEHQIHSEDLWGEALPIASYFKNYLKISAFEYTSVSADAGTIVHGLKLNLCFFISLDQGLNVAYLT